MFMKALFTRVKRLKKPKHPSTDKAKKQNVSANNEILLSL